jgi:hypothetical protein
MKRLLLILVLAATCLVAAAQSAGAGWIMQSTPSPAGMLTDALSGVACPSTTSCTAVGSYTDSSGGQPLAMASGSGGWTLESIGEPFGATSAELNAVACTKNDFCQAVGDYVDASGQFAWGAEWDGAFWNIESVPNPTGTTASTLSGIHCVGVTCQAVGS